jgi:peroxiredoxin Q/BCP
LLYKSFPAVPSSLLAGDRAPLIALPDGNGIERRSDALGGKPLVLFFYPKDDTPGCTKEACGFRDAKADLAKHGAVVLGVSPDGPASHEAFRARYTLAFTLLCDSDHAVAEKYGAWREKNMYGKKSMGIARSTFIIDAAGRVVKVFKAVKADGHADQVLAVLAETP